MSVAQGSLDDCVEAALVERLSRPDAADLLVPRVDGASAPKAPSHRSA
jgi:hypothetical protein